MRLSNRLVTGMVAGAVGTTMLNIATYLDIAVRGRLPSDVPEQVGDEVTDKLNVSQQLGDEETAGNRRSALGALAGLISGIAWGSLYGLIHPSISSISPAARSAGLGVVIIVGNDVPAIAAGATRPSEWGSPDGRRISFRT